ncbi:prepilin-type N-terminal cleavage/methylation domain-containing protein [Neobacillus sp. D3-1R]|uniref:prepilin-type N-terminal cleavage/methylation domain-containing protein n=1 Tax=Neobacillus sp. D3-1R TaxID=3445778 RepID=UPI003F9EFB21
MVKNSNGLTLIELLLALAISSVFIVIIWVFFFQGIQFSNIVSDKNSVQQEANYVLRSITRFHQTSKSVYTITFDQNPNASYFSFTNNIESITMESPRFSYSIYQYNPLDGSEQLLQNNVQINPNKVDLPIKIVVKDIQSPTTLYEIKTVISKIKGG